MSSTGCGGSDPGELLMQSVRGRWRASFDHLAWQYAQALIFAKVQRSCTPESTREGLESQGSNDDIVLYDVMQASRIHSGGS